MMVSRVRDAVGAFVPAPLRIVITCILFLIVLHFQGFSSWRNTEAWSTSWFVYMCGSFVLGHDVSNLCGWRGYKLYATAFYCWFMYLWMLWGWRENAPGTPGWWFDAAGHMLFPVVTAQFFLTRLSVQNPRKWAKERFDVEEKAFLYVLVLAVVWEFLECGIDMLQSVLGWWEVLLQKGDKDTMIDIFLSVPFAGVSIWLRRVYEWRGKKINPTGMEEVDSKMQVLEELVEERDVVDAEIAMQVREIRFSQRQNFSVFTRPIRERFARVLRRRRRKRKNIQTMP